ncbi:MAG: efflux transporter outer membrane subunit [Pseudomonadota bacterium]|jgi:outer membrane protein, multidrug efflux system|uniref:efflux transporter outer membrane subunit n=1 Tax=Aquabacterium sp. TaxID=1872578 RepID=UPI003BAE8FE9
MNNEWPTSHRAFTAKVSRLTLAAMVSLMAGCAVGPDYQKPLIALPEQFKHRQDDSEDMSQRGQKAAQDHRFWLAFGDPELARLVDQAQAANKDLGVAVSHYAQARALLSEARGDQLPTVTMGARGGHEKLSIDQSYGFPRSHDNYSVGVLASWELDLFGRVRRKVEAQRAEVKASEHEVEALRIAIVGETAATYMTLRGLQERLKVVQDNVENQRQMLNLVDVRVKAGRGTDFDSTRALAQFQSTAARVPVIEASIAVAQHRLAVLTGQQPESLDLVSTTARPLPTLPARISPDTPGDVLRRRPDIAAAEERLKAATARIGVAVGDLFPKFSFSGLVGYQAFKADDVFSSRGAMNSGFLGVDWSFLDVSRVKARIAASESEASAQMLQYQQTVLLALEDTENALVRYSRTRMEDSLLEQAARDSTKAAGMARMRYQSGMTDLYELLDAERAVLSVQEQFVDARTRSALNAVALFKAMAGGWPQPDQLAANQTTARKP